MRRRMALPTVTACVLAMNLGPAAAASAAGPVVEHAHYTDYIVHDDFFLDLCGIDTNTSVTETDTLKTWPDGSQTFHVERTFVPEDPRLPIERGSGTAYYAADHETLLRIVGKPLQLFEPGGGIRVLDAGQSLFGPDGTVLHGHIVVGVDAPDLAAYYCPTP